MGKAASFSFHGAFSPFIYVFWKKDVSVFPRIQVSASNLSKTTYLLDYNFERFLDSDDWNEGKHGYHFHCNGKIGVIFVKKLESKTKKIALKTLAHMEIASTETAFRISFSERISSCFFEVDQHW